MTRWMGSASFTLLLTGAMVLARPGTAVAQTDAGYRQEKARWTKDFAVLSGNALLGGLIAGIGQELHGGSFRDGFTRGALGGGIAFVGKRIAAARWDGAGFVGREVAAVGASVTRNALEARGSLEQLVLPVGPVRLYVTTGPDAVVRPKIDVYTLVATVSAVSDSRLRFDLGASLSAGAPAFDTDRALFRADEGLLSNGSAFGGLVAVRGLADHHGSRGVQSVFAHERVHVLQQDFMFLAFADPLEDWAVRMVPWGNSIERWLDANVSYFLLTGALISAADLQHGERPWEIEAEYFEAR